MIGYKVVRPFNGAVEQQDYIVPANSFLCRKIKVIGLAKERC